jgi:hypothetical protein
VLQLAMFADKKVNAYTTIAAWKQAGLRLPAEDTPEFYPYGDSPSVTEEQPKAEVDKLKEENVATIPARGTFKKIRWIAVLPAAFVAANLVVLADTLVFFLIYNNTGDWLSLKANKHLRMMANAFLIPFAFVYVGAYVAPSRKFATGVVLSVVCLIGLTVFLTVAATDPTVHMSFFAVYMPLIYIAGISCGFYQAYKADKTAIARQHVAAYHASQTAKADQDAIARQRVAGYDAFRTGKQIWMDSLTGGDPPELRESKKKEALRYFDQAIGNGFDTSEAFSFRGSCLNALGFYFDALADYDKAIQKQPTKAVAANYYMRSQIKQSLLDFHGSLTDVNEAIRLSKLDNDDNRWWDKHAQKIGYNSHTEFCEESLSWLKRLIEREETHPTDKSVELSKIKRRDLG